MKVLIEYIGSLEEADFGEGGKWRKGEKREVDKKLAEKLLRKPYFKTVEEEVKKDVSGNRK